MKTLLVALNAQYMHTNLALRQILAALPSEANALLYEGHINLPYRGILERIVRAEPEAVGFSAYIWNAALVFRLCRALRAALPGVRLFVGGPEVEKTPREVLSRHPAIDYVLSGEGEITVPALLSGLAPERVPGLSWREGEGIRVNDPPSPLHPSAWPDVWAGEGARGLEGRILYIETSRGCPYRCKYCLSGGAGAVRALSAEESVRRLTALAERGVSLIKLVDRTFNFDRARAAVIWEGLIRHARETGVKLTYHFEIGAQLLDEAAFSVLARAPKGLFQFEAGIQSSDDLVLRAAGRGVRFAQIRQPLERVAALKTIHLHVDLIAGLPGATMATFARSFDDACGLGADKLQLGFLKLLPGSALREEAGELGLVCEPDPPYEVLFTPDLSIAQLCHLKDVEKALDWYGGSGRYRRSMRHLIGRSSPFAFYSVLARALRAQGALERELRERDRAQWLLQMHDSPALRALMTHDLLCAGMRRELPEALQYQEDAPLRALLRERYHPVRGQCACRYDFDVEGFDEEGELIPRETVVFYDRQR